MFTPHTTKSTIGRVATSLKLVVVLMLLGLIAIATERPMLLTSARAVTVPARAAYLAQHGTPRASTGVAPSASTAAATTAADGAVYFPSQFNESSGAGEDLPPQF